jgi:hypothetical protein
MSRRSLVAVTSLIALAAAIAEPTPTVLLLLVCSVLSLSLGYRFRRSFLTFVAAWLLFFPLGGLLGDVVGAAWGFLSAAVVVIVIGERLSFDSDLAWVLEAPEGVDTEAEKRATKLKLVHGRSLALYVVLCVAVVGVSAPAAGVLSYAPILIAAVVLLMFATYSYVRG